MWRGEAPHGGVFAASHTGPDGGDSEAPHGWKTPRCGAFVQSVLAAV